MNINKEQLIEDLIRDEGMEVKPYFDKYGYISFGVGRNLYANPLTPTERQEGLKLGFGSKEFIKFLLERDVDKVIRQIKALIPWVEEHPESVQRALANMAFQMGITGLIKFRTSLPLVQKGRYLSAGRELRNSKWYRQDSPGRAERVIQLIENNEEKR